ncbi:hypothetical protein D0865_12236 [Hortaea werneckii]|uniref:BTB domain-containing protein n=1 Tax=Hortaea werneckii TaxID=91943 RepID=A0A3M7BP57_HORWE|nr:hypothetical protein D0865_12236 [Hortaea werneckii]
MANTNDADDKLQHAALLSGLKSQSGFGKPVLGRGRYSHLVTFQWTSLTSKQEGKLGKITLKDDPQVVDALLHWLYNFDYGDYGNSQDHYCPSVLDVRVYAAADKYLLPNLKRLAAEKFEKGMKAEWESGGFVNAIQEAYVVIPESDRTLKKIIIEVASKHKLALLHPSKGSEDFKRLTAELPEFGKDLLVASTITWIDEEWVKYRCPSCKLHWAMPDQEKSFTCPRECYNKQDPSWWVSYKEA